MALIWLRMSMQYRSAIHHPVDPRTWRSTRRRRRVGWSLFAE
jgi:hypothetical protein